ncbi:hypothetical protein HNO88_000797 [Novosphingobium chloroacetimidivorans]|uniref:Uncharacterized protein n=1 Tax=Novosphingobium chloroacetimidivorans TaxID=1428314 RepID=A0A7W7K7Q1_9SPHN|nr:hypothetical protein [Novosphingobium chloroacetimidivorans]MBB4857490.1 hypothetical protein [Novosphingobium chloroacetimidivorans]
MRSTYQDATVRLYHLDDAGEGGAATTLFYGPLSQALALAAQQDEATQEALWIATDNDVVAYLDLEG